MSSQDLPDVGQAIEWEVQEKPFFSSMPLIGPLVVRLRTAWNNVATKWYVRLVLEQQNAFNRLTTDQTSALSAQLVEQDRQGSEMAHDIAQLTAQIAQLRIQLEELQEQLDHLEKTTGNNSAA